MGVEYYKGKPIPLFESVKFNKEIGYGLSASEDCKSYLLYEFKDKEGNDKGISQLPI